MPVPQSLTTTIGIKIPSIAVASKPLSCCCLQPITKKEFNQIFWPASMHAIGHIAANLSFAAVAISLTHTVKTLEPAFNVVLARALLGTATPAPVIATLVPIMVSCECCRMFSAIDGRAVSPLSCAGTSIWYCLAPQVGVAMAAELSFNWMGFISAMISNLTFGFRAVLSKKCVLLVHVSWRPIFECCIKMTMHAYVKA
jgi:Triose-phosphate Transporter family